MSLSVTPFVPQNVDLNSLSNNFRLSTNQGESCWPTAFKVMAVVTGILASIASLIYLGPLIGLVIPVVIGTGLLWTFNSCAGNSHSHPSNGGPPITPWYQRMFSFVPTGYGREPHIRVGGGHINPSPRQAPLFPTGIQMMNNHIPVGRGHSPGRGGGGGRAPAPPPNPHIPVGRGHIPGFIPNPPPPNPHFHGGPAIFNPPLPPPSGPSGHVPVGGR